LLFKTESLWEYFILDFKKVSLSKSKKIKQTHQVRLISSSIFLGSFYLTLIFVLIFYFRPYSLKLLKPIPLESPQTRPFITFSPLPQTSFDCTIGEAARIWNTTVWKSLRHMILLKLPLNFICTMVCRMVRRTRRISHDCPINIRGLKSLLNLILGV